ncbi:uncharacterized protein EDB93DRAFT_1247577 [Suillus bovinus]|uniref:uncharacterized protein n=1 Tax=Suillus bovinus TaxID=48563 RepID=UPI001B87B342|nr:uncharacterized protein EDB93DRAFT_1247577 [Suillus bovinus]KAG2155937.1 hypothetical protein EDB93DRAFT_1247577 [Suillus bovinus]
MPSSPFNDTLDLATHIVAKLDDPALQTVHLHSDIIQVRSPWFGLHAPKETTNGQSSAADNTPVYKENSLEDVKEILSNIPLPPTPGVAGPDSESEESNDDEPETLASIGAGSSKGKIIDPREWAAASLEEEELDVEAQQVTFESWKAAKVAAGVSNTDSGDTSTEKAMHRSIEISQEEIEHLVQEQAIEAIRATEA